MREDYIISFNDFEGSIDLFFSYIKKNKSALKDLSLNSLLQGYLEFIDNLDLDLLELLKFYTFFSILLEWKSELLCSNFLTLKKSREREIVKKIFKTSLNYNELKEDKKALREQLNDNFEGLSFLFDDKRDKEYIERQPLKINLEESEIREPNKYKKNTTNFNERENFKSEIKNLEKVPTLRTYLPNIYFKKQKLNELLLREKSLLFDNLLLDLENENYYVFEKFCYALIILEYFMDGFLDLFYENNNLILMAV